MLTPKITPTKTVMIILAFQPIFFATALPAFTATESEELPDEEERADVVLPDEELFLLVDFLPELFEPDFEPPDDLRFLSSSAISYLLKISAISFIFAFAAS